MSRLGFVLNVVLVTAALSFGSVSRAQNWEDAPPQTSETQAEKVPTSTPTEGNSKTSPSTDNLVKGLESYNLWVLKHREKAFEQQHIATWVIFTVVHALIVFGAVLSWLQFRRGRSEDLTTLKLGKDGIAVSSPILGVIILTLSFGFYYMYIAHVYEIKPVAEQE